MSHCPFSEQIRIQFSVSITTKNIPRFFVIPAFNRETNFCEAEVVPSEVVFQNRASDRRAWHSAKAPFSEGLGQGGAEKTRYRDSRGPGFTPAHVDKLPFRGNWPPESVSGEAISAKGIPKHLLKPSLKGGFSQKLADGAVDYSAL